jgi:hypothetical protein
VNSTTSHPTLNSIGLPLVSTGEPTLSSVVPFIRRLGKATECLEEGPKAWESGVGGRRSETSSFGVCIHSYKIRSIPQHY